jgi:hypothetical protein
MCGLRRSSRHALSPKFKDNMPKRESRQKVRHQRGLPAEDDVVERVKSLSVKPWVRSVESEFHGNRNQLAIWIHVSERATQEELVHFEGELFDFLSGYFRAHDFRFSWSIGIWSNGSPISSISSSDRPGQYCSVCMARFSWMFDQCPRCETN